MKTNLSIIIRKKCQNNASRNQTLTFSHQEGLRGVTAAAVTGSAGVATAVLLLHSLDRQRSVVLAQNHTWKPIGMVVLTAAATWGERLL